MAWRICLGVLCPLIQLLSWHECLIKILKVILASFEDAELPVGPRLKTDFIWSAIFHEHLAASRKLWFRSLVSFSWGAMFTSKYIQSNCWSYTLYRLFWKLSCLHYIHTCMHAFIHTYMHIYMDTYDSSPFPLLPIYL